MSSLLLRPLARGWSRYLNVNLVARIIVGIILGVGLALIAPQWTFLGVVGSIFVSLLKSVAPVLVFTLVIASLAQEGKSLDARFGSMILLYLASTFVAAASATTFCFLFPVSIQI